MFSLRLHAIALLVIIIIIIIIGFTVFGTVLSGSFLCLNLVYVHLLNTGKSVEMTSKLNQKNPQESLFEKEWTLFSFEIILYLRGRETDKENSHPLVHSPNVCTSREPGTPLESPT